jgi:hypothetical protein
MFRNSGRGDPCSGETSERKLRFKHEELAIGKHEAEVRIVAVHDDFVVLRMEKCHRDVFVFNTIISE